MNIAQPFLGTLNRYISDSLHRHPRRRFGWVSCGSAPFNFLPWPIRLNPTFEFFGPGREGATDGADYTDSEKHETNPCARRAGGEGRRGAGEKGGGVQVRQAIFTKRSHCAKSESRGPKSERSPKPEVRTQFYQTNPTCLDRRFQDFRSQIVAKGGHRPVLRHFYQTKPSLGARFKVSGSRFKVLKNYETKPNPKEREKGGGGERGSFCETKPFGPSLPSPRRRKLVRIRQIRPDPTFENILQNKANSRERAKDGRREGRELRNETIALGAPVRRERRFRVSGSKFGGIRKMRNEAIPEEREKGGWGAGEDGGATGDFYQTKPINSPAHFTPGGLKSALHVNYGTNPLGGQKVTGERESWIPHSNFFIRV